jgi:predicted permease
MTVFLTRDLREASRSLRRTPRFTLLCASILGVGIGLSTAMFAAVNALLLRPLPILDQNRVAVLWAQNRNRPHVPLAVSDARRFVEQSQTMPQIAFVDRYFSQPLFVRDAAEYFLGNGDLVSGNFFQTLGVAPALGRLLEPSDDRRGADPVVVLSYSFWQKHYGGSSTAIGRHLQVHGETTLRRIIGVVPRGFTYPANTELWLPLVPNSIASATDTVASMVDLVGRLAPGASPLTAQSELTAFLHDPTQRETLRTLNAVVQPFPEIVLGNVRPTFRALSIAVAVLLLVACMNVAALLLMRGLEMGREIAVRTAIGASAGQIVRHQAAEGLVLAALSGAIGIAVARGALTFLIAVAPQNLPRFDAIHLDTAAVVAAFAITVVTAVLFATGPALVAARTDPSRLLRAGAQSLSGGRGHRRAREALMIAQVAAAVVVLSGASLIARTLLELQRAELGFEKDRVLIVELAWDFNRLGTSAGSRSYFDALLPRLYAIRGIEAASPILLAPFPAVGWGLVYRATDRPVQDQQNNPTLNIEVVSPGYFDVFRLRARRGRVLAATDREGAPSAVVLSEQAARILWPNGDALGKRLVPSADPLAAPSTVVGIVADTRYENYRIPPPTIYFSQHQPPAAPFDLVATMIAVRVTPEDPRTLLPQITTAVRETNAGVLVDKAVTLREHLDAPLAQPRFNAALLSTFAVAAALIVATGLYAVLAFTVRTRARELAIRSAIGATPGSLRALVLRSAAMIVGYGVALGLVSTLAGTRLFESMLYNLTSNDLASTAVGVSVLALLAFVASIAPARIASRVSMIALLRDS